MSTQPNTSLNLNLNLPTNEHNLNFLLDHSSSSSSYSRAESRIFTCNYCRRKFYSSQALGGHQNAHKLERTLAKKSRELSSAAGHINFNKSTQRSQGSSSGSGSSSHEGQEKPHGQAHSARREFKYDPLDANVQEEFSQLDLSLRL